eukprot:TRINITY_DN3820_c2_g1_i1.p1 TRINITY_DN3820_c2_g1~~TRINITY_DN3820_c2_g1_i1.p1  ORF type:complete len:244 (-),score=36.98 TRINITY_DN3820_c2_g1_i1:19-750(-)
MAHSCPMSAVECELQCLDGSEFTLTAQLEWDVATLKERIEQAISVPSCLQVLSDNKGKLLNKVTLREVCFANNCVASRLFLFLTCMDVPSQLSQAEVQRAWEAFRIHSTDYGDTIPQASLARVLHYQDMDIRGCQVEKRLADFEFVSFADVLSVTAAVNDASSATASEEVVAEEIAAERRSFDEPDFAVADETLAALEALHERQHARPRPRKAKRKSAKARELTAAVLQGDEGRASAVWPQSL